MGDLKKRRPVVSALARMESSCFGDPSTELAAALHENNLRLFCDILAGEDIDVNAEMPAHGFSTILHMAVLAGKTAFVTEILRHREANPNMPHRTEKRYPLHVAAETAQVDIMELLVRCGAEVNAKMENGSTALHVLAVRSAARWAQEQDREEVKRRFVAATRFLANQPGVLVDPQNNIGVTPLYFAAEKGTEGVARVLLEAGASISIEVDGDTVENLLVEKMPELYKSVDLRRNRRAAAGDTIENKLFHLLYLEAQTPGKFIPAWHDAEQNNNKVDVNADNGTYTFLQYSCDQGLAKVVEFLLSKLADPNYYCDNYKMPPLVIAGHHGYYEIIRIFKDKCGKEVDFSATDGIKQENVLHKILKAESKAYVNYEKRNYDRCLHMLLDNNRGIKDALNAQDHMGNTPLHVAAANGNDDAIRSLLRLGSSIGFKNNQGVTPIEKIPPDIMEEFLDDCLEGDGKPSDDEFKAIFSYGFLGPPINKSLREEQKRLKDEHVAEDDENEGEEEEVLALPEAEPLWYLSRSARHKTLLIHPVISSFLCLKWRKIRPYYYINLTFYLAFVSLLTSYLIITTNDMNNDSSAKPETAPSAAPAEDPQVEGESSVPGLKVATTVFLVILAVRELFQAMVSFRRYIFSLENLLEVAMILIIFCLFFAPIENEGSKRSLAAAALLLSWTEMVLLFGKHPMLSTYIAMFNTVSLNFFLFLLWYVSLIVAFGLAFFIILHHPEPEENAYFSTASKSLFKTVVMSLTGELEFESVKFEVDFSVFIYLLYIFYIILVLINLLNAIAVSDISAIQQEATVLSHVSRVEMISYVESMLLGDPFQFLTNWPPIKWLRKLPSCSCLGVIYALRPVRKGIEAAIGNTLLFRRRLRQKRAVFYPNLSPFERSLPGKAKDNLRLDGPILKRAMELLAKKRSGLGVDARLESIEKAQLLQAKQLNHIIELLSRKK